MERLVAWYRVGSSYGALIALVLANLIPLAGVIFLGWSVWQILIIYWLENGIVGLYNVLKMQKAEGTDEASATVTINGRRPVGDAKSSLIPFFCLHYGIFWTVHGVFVLTLPLFGASETGGESSLGTTPDPLVLVIAVIALLISHGVSYLVQLHRRRRVQAGVRGRPDVQAVRTPRGPAPDDHLRRDGDLDHGRGHRRVGHPGAAQARARHRPAPGRTSRPVRDTATKGARAA